MKLNKLNPHCYWAKTFIQDLSDDDLDKYISEIQEFNLTQKPSYKFLLLEKEVRISKILIDKTILAEKKKNNTFKISKKITIEYDLFEYNNECDEIKHYEQLEPYEIKSIEKDIMKQIIWFLEKDYKSGELHGFFNRRKFSGKVLITRENK